MTGRNLIGMDVSRWNVAEFLARSELMMIAVFLLGLVWLSKKQQPALLWAAILGGNAYVFWVTNAPLMRLYALGPSYDRLGNVGLCQVVATGNSALQTYQVGQLHFEPFWSALVAALAGFDPVRVLRLYPFLPLIMALAYALSLGLGLRMKAAGDAAEGAWGTWERAVIALFATLLSSSPLDYAGPYRVPWSMMFLLKPNHALGLVLFPIFLACFVRLRTWRGRVLVGLLLHLLAWAFVLHMVYACFGLLVWILATWLFERADIRRALLDVGVVIGVNLLIVSPYLCMLLIGYPFLTPGPRMMIPPFSAHLLEVTTRLGPIFWLGVWGLVVIARRRDRLARVFVAQVVGAYLIWLGYYVLHFLQQAREKDEIYFWIRFLIAAAAGVGAWDALKRMTAGVARLRAPARRAALLCLIAAPHSIVFFWDPVRMDDYFERSREPLPEIVSAPAAYLRERTARQTVLAGDHEFARWAAALAGRRSLLGAGLHTPKDYLRRLAVEERLMRSGDAAAARSAAASYGIEYLIVTPALLALYAPVTLAEIEARPYLHEVHLTRSAEDFVAIYRIGEARDGGR
ncbi:MAG: hypothetical protein MUF51_01540 [Vicinamibacteria bacterium]|nr:hypothetical protein [Vicinamibacteria bacterium]